jgi:predicted nucleic acid-binding protein
VSRLVLDASVAVKWYLPEIHGDRALRVLEGGHELLAPDLLYAEVGSALWKRVKRGEILESEAEEVLASLGRLPIRVYGIKELAPPAFEIACASGQTVYDSLYLAVAVSGRCPLFTADRSLYDAVKRTVLAEYVLWVEDEI